jgi:hypothetical protein
LRWLLFCLIIKRALITLFSNRKFSRGIVL